jgi:hypothetical protein
MREMATVMPTSPLVSEDFSPSTAASVAFIPVTHGFEVGHLAMPTTIVALPEAYEPVPLPAEASWDYFSQASVSPVADFRLAVRLFQRMLADAKRQAAESLADGLEDRHAHRSSMRRLGEDPRLAQFVGLGSAATSVALRRLGERRHRPLWLFVLQSMSDARPAQGVDGLDGAARAWRDWGRGHGLIP